MQNWKDTNEYVGDDGLLKDNVFLGVKLRDEASTMAYLKYYERYADKVIRNRFATYGLYLRKDSSVFADAKDYVMFKVLETYLERFVL